MKLIKKTTTLLTFLLCFSTLTSAQTKSYIIEPYVGTEYGNWSETQTVTVSSTTTTYNLAGYSLGYLVGSKVLYILGTMFLLGIDYQMAGITKKYTESESSTIDDGFQDVSASKTAFGVVLGIFRNKWTFKFSYFPINNLVMEKGIVTGSSEFTYSGNALVGNFSYAFRPRIYLNLEYVSNTYDSIKNSSSSGSLPGSFGGVSYSDLSDISYRAYVSFPF